MNDLFVSRLNFQVEPPSSELIDRRRFALATVDTACERRDFALILATEDFTKSVAEAIEKIYPGEEVKFSSWSPGDYHVTVGDRALIQLNTGSAADTRRFGHVPHNFQVHATGPREFVDEFFAFLHERYGDARIATVTWWYKAGSHMTYRTVPIEKPKPVYDEYYPFLTGGVEAYLDAYLADPASLLFMMGPPGTGKTSLIRHFIYSRRLEATVTYDHELLNSDEMFVGFLCSWEPGVLIIEDADLKVGSREKEHNELITRFLNVSDGLIKTSNKKIIFTANLRDFDSVDPALVRAGRCFDALRFRPLTRSEACRAADRAEIGTIPDGDAIPLSDVFAAPSGRAATLTRSAFGT